MKLARVLWVLWLLGFVVWTYLLVVPTYWLPSFLAFTGSGAFKWLSWAKVGHISAYALLTGWVWMLAGRRWPLWLLMIGHAGGTEIAQSFVPTRTGQLADVGIDLIGIAFGFALGGLGHWLFATRVTAAPQPQRDAGREDQGAHVLG